MLVSGTASLTHCVAEAHMLQGSCRKPGSAACTVAHSWLQQTRHSALQCALLEAGQNDAGHCNWPGLPSALPWCLHAGLYPRRLTGQQHTLQQPAGSDASNQKGRPKQPASPDLRSWGRRACRLQQGGGPHSLGRTTPAPTPQGQGSTLPTTHALTGHTTAAAGDGRSQGAPAWGAAAEGASA